MTVDICPYFLRDEENGFVKRALELHMEVRSGISTHAGRIC